MILRKIITPKKSSLTLRLPEEMVGKTIEVIVVEINPEKTSTKAQRMREIEALTKSTLVDLTSFKSGG